VPRDFLSFKKLFDMGLQVAGFFSFRQKLHFFLPSKQMYRFKNAFAEV